MGPIVDESQRRTIEEYVEGARAEGAEVFQVQLDKVPGKRWNFLLFGSFDENISVVGNFSSI